eukprot:CAMPEP_0201895950 /NCGR_PEP_ID=MMETSP0902-20130614/43589_1 /ASSEMBLY_ACC=CAM_ASM_000551 /TAXON_ID=420261 /ORGANISM="Thalassiosira antarctica, Strain CCMP982" /LENGTH=456 /DNA_ID=CAMNT_0048428403 /DNA_START=402 /DNA_END=1775 /DNA_ORIENTATION=-
MEQHGNAPARSDFGARGKNDSDVSSDRSQYVICTRVQNEAPYLREWIEYHRMIGFEAFLLMNDGSHDDTQCVLDAYADEGLVIHIPTDIEDYDSTLNEKLNENVDHIFDMCVDYLNNHQDRFDPSRTWMMTHDVDEFVFIKTGSNSSIHDAVTHLSQSNHPQALSLVVPRLAFGSSRHDNFQPGLVIDRFTRRYNHESCSRTQSKGNSVNYNPRPKAQKNRRPHTHLASRLESKKRLSEIRDRDSLHSSAVDIHRRRLFAHENPKSYCHPGSYYSRSSYDKEKSISLVSSMAQECYARNKTTGRVVLVETCSNTHKHTLVDVSKHRGINATSRQARGNKDRRGNHPRSIGTGSVGKVAVIMHYMTKSRHEFYKRVCDSVWSDKYFQCPECTPETYFNLTETYANNFEDTRMAPFSSQLKQNLKYSDIGASCNTQPELHSLDHHRQCFYRIKETLGR